MPFSVYAVVTLGFSSQHFIFNAIQRLINYLPIYLFAFKLVDQELICMSFWRVLTGFYLSRVYPSWECFVVDWLQSATLFIRQCDWAKYIKLDVSRRVSIQALYCLTAFDLSEYEIVN